MPNALQLRRSSRLLYLANCVEECIVRNNLPLLSTQHQVIQYYDALHIMDEYLARF